MSEGYRAKIPLIPPLKKGEAGILLRKVSYNEHDQFVKGCGIPMLKVYLFGKPRAVDVGGRPVKLTTSKVEQLLAFLLLKRDCPYVNVTVTLVQAHEH